MPRATGSMLDGSLSAVASTQSVRMCFIKHEDALLACMGAKRGMQLASTFMSTNGDMSVLHPALPYKCTSTASSLPFDLTATCSSHARVKRHRRPCFLTTHLAASKAACKVELAPCSRHGMGAYGR